MTREIRSRRVSARSDVRDLLESVFVGLLLCPAGELWIVSPWVSNIEVVDNSAGRFRGVLPGGDFSRLRLSEVLAELASRGTEVTVVTKTGEAQSFVHSLREATASTPSRNLYHLDQEVLHEKGIHSESFAITGSMNLTWNGVNHNDEFVRFDHHRDGNREAIGTFRDRYAETRVAL